ncbi:MAG: DUF4153 domain-containing protein, partial [Chloroflexota bacterium]
MERRSFAVVTVGTGLMMGLLGNIFFFNHMIGVSFPIYILLAVALVLILSRPAGQAIHRRNLWLLLPLAFFAVMSAVRADQLITVLDITAALTLGAVGLYYFPLTQNIDTEPLVAYPKAIIETGFMIPAYAVTESVESWRWLSEKRHQRGNLIASIVRGGVFALPIILVFAVLLGSADAVFASYVNQAFEGVRQALGLQFLGDTMSHLLLTGFLTVSVSGSLGYVLLRRPIVIPAAPASLPDEESADGIVLPDTKPKSKPRFKLS